MGSSVVTAIYSPDEPGYLRDAADVIDACFARVLDRVDNEFFASFAQIGYIGPNVAMPRKGENPSVSAGVSMVGTTGIEPVTPTMSKS
jgi:hypothetical protein